MVAGAASKLSQMRAIKLLNGRTHKKEEEEEEEEEEASKSKPFYLLHSTLSFFSSFSRFSLRRGPVVQLLDNQATTLKPSFFTYLPRDSIIYFFAQNKFILDL